MTPPNRLPQPGQGLTENQKILFILAGIVTYLALGLHLTLFFGHRIERSEITVPSNPGVSIKTFIKGQLPFPTTGGVIVAIGFLLATLLMGFFAYQAVKVLKKSSKPVDKFGRFMATVNETLPLQRAAMTKKSTRLGVENPKTYPGVPLGRHYRGPSLFASWEDMHVDIWGPRTGKTTSRAVPAILAAPGAVLVTSNKRDVVDATREVRATNGPVWVFDPQQIALEPPSWWWNPLSYCTDETKAAQLAEHFAAGSRDPGAKTDAYFTPAGQDLLAGLLLAAALDNRPITDVYTWLTRPMDDTPVDILRASGFEMTADQVAGVIDAPDKQRGGIYGTAAQMASCLTNRQVAAWITRGAATEQRPHFDPAEFVRSGGTLYSLSKEGRGTAGPLVTALIVAVVEAAEELASKSPGGRLSVPLLGVLDEAANVCRWRELPNLYSHYGSRGIVLMTILQSWSQGVEVWGDAGMKKLWSAANVKVYGGGVSEAAFLEDLSRTIGDYDKLSSSASHTRGNRTVSQQLHRERILDVAALAALPQGRAVVFASGTRPFLLRPIAWMMGPKASEVRASIEMHDPGSKRSVS